MAAPETVKMLSADLDQAAAARANETDEHRRRSMRVIAWFRQLRPKRFLSERPSLAMVASL